MRLQVTKLTPKPPVDLFGGPSGPFAGEILDIHQFVDSIRADAWICPYDLFDIWQNKEYVTYLRKIAEEKPLIVFNRGDRPKHFCHPNVISLQTTVDSGQACNKHKIIVVPYNINIENSFRKRQFSPTPSVTFMGYAPAITVGRIFRSLWPLPARPIRRNGAIIRSLGIRELSRFPESSITAREYYSGTHKIHSTKESTREIYLDSLSNSDFVFCPRGDGNGSQRFYETLAMGRIPIIPNTDVILPKCETSFPENSFLLAKATSSDIVETVMGFWETLSEKTYLEHQLMNRNFYERNLLYKTFFLNLFKDEFSNIDTFVI